MMPADVIYILFANVGPSIVSNYLN